jgi:hypothetical protein
MLGRKGCLGTKTAGNNHVIINVIIIVCQDLEGVVMLCQTLVLDRQPTNCAWHHDGFDVVTTLRGVAITTLGGGSDSTLGDVGRGGGKLS